MSENVIDSENTSKPAPDTYGLAKSWPRMPFLGVRRAFSGVAGGGVAIFSCLEAAGKAMENSVPSGLLSNRTRP